MRRRDFRPELESPEVRIAPSAATVAIGMPAPAVISATPTCIGKNPPPTSGPVGPGTS